ncbi:hypothetical protein BDY17DRAFT_299366 [Neohortaea acidophila]|uniref:Pentatricopeptide repeat protein n=1 Tax=Neohortaea acidophila TaxID=245834 RepID=A0A6A6PNE2_9PEZI|nr:uncharacterized protein BDY17DRAFT_299366 [Neohortaea acidophila]KAF2481630.1 hypothetical protein BDY17DRAFT_299366 [Neohortaea acidophila]
MFTRGPRRPLPSARTIRLLYQFGYIATGTAAGLVTLCLEEQRRRIQILQKVVDNARVIRSHPKYRGSHSFAAATWESSEDEGSWWGSAAPQVEDTRVERPGFFGGGRRARARSAQTTERSSITTRNQSSGLQDGGTGLQSTRQRREERFEGASSADKASSTLSRDVEPPSSSPVQRPTFSGPLAGDRFQEPAHRLSDRGRNALSKDHRAPDHPLFHRPVRLQDRSHAADTTEVPQQKKANTCDLALGKAITEDRTDECLSLLHSKVAAADTRAKIKSVGAEIDAFIKACNDSGRHWMLATALRPRNRLLARHSRSDLLQRYLIPQSLRAIQHALVATQCPQWEFEEIWKMLPDYLRLSFDPILAIPSLQAYWKFTRDLTKVDKYVAEKLKKEMEQYKDHEAKLQELNFAMVGIYADAGFLDRSVELLAQMQGNEGASNELMRRFAILLAHKHDWDSLSRLFTVIEHLPTPLFEEKHSTTFNTIIMHYAKEHSPTETWNFVAHAMESLTLRPTRMTAQLVMENFVRHNTFDLIPKWLAFQSECGFKTDMDARLARNLLQEHYLKYRPPHDLLMTWCRRLAVFYPAIMNKQLQDLLRGAITYDMHDWRGTGRGNAIRFAKVRLDLIEDTRHIIPSPGFVFREELYLPDSSASIVEGSAIPTPISTSDDVSDASDASDDMMNFEEPNLPTAVGYSSSQNHLRARKRTWTQDEALEEHDILGASPQFSVLYREMWLEVQKRNYRKALELYRDSLDPAGLPPVAAALELAVEASIRLHRGDRVVAEQLMASARKAGMNTAAATRPFLIHTMRTLYHSGKHIDSAELETNVLRYYEANFSNNQRLTSYVANTAATVLLHRNSPAAALRLLSVIHGRWPDELPVTNVVCTIQLQCHTALRSLPGVQSVLQTMLDKDFRIQRRFLLKLNDCKKNARKFEENASQDVAALLESWLGIFREKRAKQTEEAKQVGEALLAVLVSCSEHSAPLIPATHEETIGDGRAADEHGTGTAVYVPFIDESYFSDEPEPTDGAKEAKRLATLRQRMIRDIEDEAVFRWHTEKRLREAHLQSRVDDSDQVYRPFDAAEADSYEAGLHGDGMDGAPNALAVVDTRA